MRGPTKLLAAIERLEQEVVGLVRSDGPEIVAAELRALGFQVAGPCGDGVVSVTGCEDEDSMPERGQDKLRELEARGFGSVLVIFIRTYGTPAGFQLLRDSVAGLMNREPNPFEIAREQSAGKAREALPPE